MKFYFLDLYIIELFLINEIMLSIIYYFLKVITFPNFENTVSFLKKEY